MNGLSKNHIKSRIHEKMIIKDPDIYYYIDNPDIERLMEIMIEVFSEVVEENNEELIKSMVRDFQRM